MWIWFPGILCLEAWTAYLEQAYSICKSHVGLRGSTAGSGALEYSGKEAMTGLGSTAIPSDMMASRIASKTLRILTLSLQIPHF